MTLRCRLHSVPAEVAVPAVIAGGGGTLILTATWRQDISIMHIVPTTQRIETRIIPDDCCFFATLPSFKLSIVRPHHTTHSLPSFEVFHASC